MIPARYRIQSLCLTTLLTVLCLSCGGAEALSVNVEPSATAPSVYTFSANMPVEQWQAIAADGGVIQQGRLDSLQEGELIVASPNLFALRFFSADDQFTFETGVGLGEQRADIRTPFEADVRDGIPLIAVPNTTVSIIISPPADWQAGFHLRCGPGLLPAAAKEKMKTVPIHFAGPGPRALEIVVQADAPAESYLALEQNGSALFRREVTIRSPSVLSREITITSSDQPVDPQGKPLGGQNQDFLDIGRVAPDNPATMQAATWQRLQINNTSELHVPVIITATILDNQGHPARAFNAPPGLPGPSVVVAAELTAQAVTDVVLPVYVDPALAETGDYQRQAVVTVAGTDIILDRNVKPLTVVNSVAFATIVTLLCTLVAITILLWLIAWRSRVLSRFSTRHIVLVGLFAAASIVAVNVPVYFLTSMTVFLLGPMGFLVDGLLSEFLFFALLVTLINLAPVQGICALLIVTRFLIGGILLGMLTPVGFLHTAVMAVALEAALFAVKRSGGKIDDGFRLATALALANCLVSWLGFQFAVVLFRLHYAGWYITLSIFIGGFLYAFLGSITGKAISRNLSGVQT